jgi:hypothetical protein
MGELAGEPRAEVEERGGERGAVKEDGPLAALEAGGEDFGGVEGVVPVRDELEERARGRLRGGLTALPVSRETRMRPARGNVGADAGAGQARPRFVG